ncbi:hypothetical protein MRB53_034380 [Persea americana]|uniref:Uncharacterized protein n=1 Tax=Persea americana TaxID=3435 RepID=A0ACC2KXV6_PERAE|nr:hypothetical protein MRB53_034380 [Persea americana]
MGRSYFLELLLIAALLSLTLSQGMGRKKMRFGEGASSYDVGVVNLERVDRGTMEVTMDYSDPGANTSPGNGYMIPTPPAGASGG